VAPLCIVMVLNVVFFSWSAFLIYLTKSKIENKSTARTDFLLFLRLALIMGLTWITAIIAGVVNLIGIGCFTSKGCLEKMCFDDAHLNIPECNMFVNPLKTEAHLNTFLNIQSLPQRKHNTSQLLRSTG
jgi:hypothetical protein